MLRSLKDLESYTVVPEDGELGKVVNFLLDDERWAVRYLIVEASVLHAGRRVLISPAFFGRADWATRCFHIALTMRRIADSPNVDTDKPVSRQHERDYYRYYGYPYYWGYGGLWGTGGYPGSLLPWAQPPRDPPAVSGDVHLRSAQEVTGYDIQGTDGPIGHVTDFIVNDETWEIAYLVVDTSHWWFGKKVLVSPHWAKEVSWEDERVSLELSRDAIKSSPPWEPGASINREYEERLYDYYGRPTYWTGHAAPNGGTPAAQPSVTRQERARGGA